MTLKDRVSKLTGFVIKDYDRFFNRMDMAGAVNQKLLFNIVKEILKYVEEKESLGEKPLKN